MAIEIISPTMGTPNGEALNLNDFTQTETGKIAACLQGYAPVRFKWGKESTRGVTFDSQDCNVCPLREECPVKLEGSVIIFALTSKPCGSPPGGSESIPRSSKTSTVGAPGLNRPFPGWTDRGQTFPGSWSGRCGLLSLFKGHRRQSFPG